MPSEPTGLQGALDRYNATYDNAAYNLIRDIVVADLYGADNDPEHHDDDRQVVDLMNALQDTCLEICGAEEHRGAHVTLAKLAAWARLSERTVDAIKRYSQKFETGDDLYAIDFECTGKALLRANSAVADLKTAVQHANGVHSWQGRMAYELLCAADYFTQAASQLLIHGNLHYIREKLQGGLRRVTGALCEAVWHSDRPDLFNFKGTSFPDENDRQ